MPFRSETTKLKSDLCFFLARMRCLFCSLLFVVVFVSAEEHQAPHNALPAVAAAPSSDSSESSSTFSFDELGPVVVNGDGTMGRVRNWKELTPAEKLSILKVVQARNAKRKAALDLMGD